MLGTNNYKITKAISNNCPLIGMSVRCLKILWQFSDFKKLGHSVSDGHISSFTVFWYQMFHSFMDEKLSLWNNFKFSAPSRLSNPIVLVLKGQLFIPIPVSYIVLLVFILLLHKLNQIKSVDFIHFSLLLNIFFLARIFTFLWFGFYVTPTL